MMTTEREYDELIRKALTNDVFWQQMTATELDALEARQWLLDARQTIQDDLSMRNAGWAAMKAKLPSHEIRPKLAEYQDWRRRALGFKKLVDARLRDLASLHGGRTKQRVEEERKLLEAALMRIAAAIEAHQAERASDADLYALLDDIQLQWGVDGLVPLRSRLIWDREKARSAS